MAQTTPTPRSILRTKIDGIAQAARVGKCESASLTMDDTNELLALVAEGDAAKAFVTQMCKSAYSLSIVKTMDDARQLSAQWPSA